MAGAETDQVRPSIRGLPIQVTAITAILALALATLAGAGAALYQRSRPSNYESFAVLLIDQPLAIQSQGDEGPLLKIQALRYYYADLVQTQLIAGPAARQAKLPTAVVANSVSAVIDPTSFTIDLVASAKSPVTSNLIAQAVAAELIDYVDKSQAHDGVVAINRVTLREATNPARGVKVVTSTRKIVLAGVVAFIVVGAVFLIIADLFRRRW